MPRENHDWVDLNRYLAIHERCLEFASSYFIDNPGSVVPEFLFEHILRIHGDLTCKGGLMLHVDKYLDLNKKNQVRCYRYRYHAQFADPPLRQIFRYDNDHVHKREGHADAFHKHVFDDRTWREMAVEHIGREQFPTLLDGGGPRTQGAGLRHRDDPLTYP